MEPGLGNDIKMHWVHRVGGKRDCFANEVGKTWLWSAGRQSEYLRALPYRELNQDPSPPLPPYTLQL